MVGGRRSLSDPCFTRNDLFAFRLLAFRPVLHEEQSVRFSETPTRTRNRLAGTAVRVKKIAFISIQVPCWPTLKQNGSLLFFSFFSCSASDATCVETRLFKFEPAHGI